MQVQWECLLLKAHKYQQEVHGVRMHVKLAMTSPSTAAAMWMSYNQIAALAIDDSSQSKWQTTCESTFVQHHNRSPIVCV